MNKICKNRVLSFFGMFVFPIRVKNYYTKYNNETQDTQKKKRKISHNCSPLSIAIAKIKQKIKINIPQIKIFILKSLFEIN